MSASRWIFDKPHPAATAGGPRWRVDLALLESDDFLAADLPARETGFQFDAFLEFAYLGDYWKVPGARIFGGDPVRGREKVEHDVKKIGSYLETGACRLGYVIVFEECDWEFPGTFVSDAEAIYGCRVRFLRSTSPPA